MSISGSNLVLHCRARRVLHCWCVRDGASLRARCGKRSRLPDGRMRSAITRYLLKDNLGRQECVITAYYYPQRRFRSAPRSEEHTSELQSLMRISYAVFCLKKKQKLIKKKNHLYTRSRQITKNLKRNKHQRQQYKTTKLQNQ